jgi:hypothetical protein
MVAVRYRAVEQFEAQERERRARVRWFEGVIQYMDGSRHQTLGSFLQSRAGKRFRRRSNWVLRIG